MNMREKIARAIYEAWAKAKGTDATWDEVVLKETYELAFAEADAVLDALMEPTNGMKEASLLAYELTGIAPGFINSAEDHVELILEAMIQAARDGA